jgi:hypothetical protein
MTHFKLGARRTGAFALLFPACTSMPPVMSYMNSSQHKVTAVQHWNLVAEDALVGLAEVLPSSAPGPVTIAAIEPNGMKPSQFSEYLESAMARVLLFGQQTSTEMAGKDPGIKAKFDKAKLVGFEEIPSQDPGACRARIITKVSVIKHHGLVARTYPGKYTLLAEGLVVIRHLAHAFSDTKFVGAVGLGKLAFWASSGFRSGDTVTEIVITTSYQGRDNTTFAENTNVYYIDSKDTALYRGQPSIDAGDSTLATMYGLPNASYHNNFQMPLGNVPVPEVAAEFRMASLGTNIFTDSSHHDISVTPDKVSACDSVYSFLVTGSDIDTAKSGYLLGTLPASNVVAIVFDSDKPRVSAASAAAVMMQVNDQSVANYGLPKIPLAVLRADGLTTNVEITVVGDSKSCVKTGKSNEVAASPFGEVSLSGGAGTQKKPVEICAAQWMINATGAGADDIDIATTKVGPHSAKVVKASGVTILTFDPFAAPEAKALGKSGTLDITLANAKKKLTKSKNIAFTCSLVPPTQAKVNNPANSKGASHATVPPNNGPATNSAPGASGFVL